MNSVDQKCVRCGRDTGRRLRLCKACASHDGSIASEIRRRVKQELAENPSYVIDTRPRADLGMPHMHVRLKNIRQGSMMNEARRSG
jgi:hypothetical protein